MYPLHMVKEIPAPWEAISGNGAVAILERTEMRLLAMSVHAVSFPFVSQKACGR